MGRALESRDEEPPDWWIVEILADREWLKAQHRACVGLLMHLAEIGDVPAEHGLRKYIAGLVAHFDEREEELEIPNIRAARRHLLERQGLQRAKEVYFAEAGSRYLKDVAKPVTPPPSSDG